MRPPQDTNAIVGSHEILFIVLDTLRMDVAQRCWAEGRLPTLAQHLPPEGWEERHTPGNFTFAAHQAFFAGFLPTPARPGRHARRFALRFEGSETTTAETCVLDAPDIVHGLADRGYHTACIGGVGFFNMRNPLGRVLPALFDESHWRPELSVADPRSFENQVEVAEEIAARAPADRRLFLFINVAALHQPNHFYLEGGLPQDTLESHAAALVYVDRHLPRLLAAVARRGHTFCIVCSDHGTAYGEDGWYGHRVGHPTVWTVPYGEFVVARQAAPPELAGRA
ncbi:MAG TPA: STM4013/SEN3800 family hydrolase [Polyangia bacterium]|jgi:hypothetical protein|nr:STM4013/SEN3800 family hydrolase [Polyangia bacterium]